MPISVTPSEIDFDRSLNVPLTISPAPIIGDLPLIDTSLHDIFSN